MAADEDDEVYDNHLLYNEKAKTDTIGSGGNSSTDLGFDEPPLPASRRSGNGSGNGTLLSSSDASSNATISSFKQAISEPEEDYVNLQYFLNQRRRANTGDSINTQSSPLPSAMTTPPVMFQSDDELDMDDDLSLIHI